MYYLDDVGTHIIEEKAEEEEVSSQNVDTNRQSVGDNSSLADADISEEVSVSRRYNESDAGIHHFPKILINAPFLRGRSSQ